MSQPRAHCASCQSEQISPPTDYSPNHASVRFAMNDAKSGWLEPSQESFQVTRARICLACGHVMWSLGPEALERLRQRAPHLVPVPEMVLKRP